MSETKGVEGEEGLERSDGLDAAAMSGKSDNQKLNTEARSVKGSGNLENFAPFVFLWYDRY